MTTFSPRVAALLNETALARGRLMFVLDATASREPTWDTASAVQGDMAEVAAQNGHLDTQLVFFRGPRELQKSAWLHDSEGLGSLMAKVRCAAGATQWARVLKHIRAEHEQQKINAAILVGDAVEEPAGELYDAAAGLGVPLFMFQEGAGFAVTLDRDGEIIEGGPRLTVESVFRELARVTNGAYGRFNSEAPKQLSELLRAVAAFAVGGRTALANQSTDAARKLLSQIK